jgi:hypothetical protein
MEALAGKLTDRQAQAALGPVLDAIKTTSDPDQLMALAQAVQALAGKLTDRQAQAALGPVLDAIKTTSDPDQLMALAHAVQALAGKLSTDAKVICLPISRSGLASARTDEEALAWAAAMEALLTPQPSKDYVAALLEAIRYPTAALRMQRDTEASQVGATDYLLGKLRDRFPEEKQLGSGDLPAVVEWVAGPPFGIDLSTPLKRPPALSEAAASSSPNAAATSALISQRRAPLAPPPHVAVMWIVPDRRIAGRVTSIDQVREIRSASRGDTKASWP